jgi:UDP-N-acetylmuramoyl-L-alanyl-D-glutamate--2,6-diaminopimelate ligase
MWQKVKNIYHLLNAVLANLWFGFPSRHLTVIGVTGTDGKTTTTSLIYHILHTAGYNASMISSVGAVIGGKEYDVGFHVTTPSPWALQRFIKKAVSSNNTFEKIDDEIQVPRHSGKRSASRISNHDERFWTSQNDRENKYLVLEVTSHAIDQNRIWGIPFDIGVLTNVTHEHLDYHKTYENYVKTKEKLLEMSRVAVVNRDDKSYELVKSKVKSQKSKVQGKSKKFITYGIKENADVNPQKFPFKTKLIGEFNMYNVLAGIAVCRQLGVDDLIIRKGILSLKPPIGREEIVYKKDFTVMVDFAHTPNAFEQILSSIKPSIKGRLIHVFGAAGQRDATKRPLMGKMSAKYSDVIVLTAEDPRSEPVGKIMSEISSGIQKSKVKSQKYNSKVKSKDDKNIVFKISDRREAINAAIKMARRGDFVLITGKSHEKSMNYGYGEEPWDEFGAVKEALRMVHLEGVPDERGHLRGD